MRTIDARRDAVLSEDGTYRTFVMLNPSTADAQVDDPTIHRCVGFARVRDIPGIRVVNLFAYRTTYPSALNLARRAPSLDATGPKNDTYIRRAFHLAGIHGTPVVVAWGAGTGLDPLTTRIRAIMTLAREEDVPLHCLGTTSNGNPKHPLARGLHRIPDDAPLIPWAGVE